MAQAGVYNNYKMPQALGNSFSGQQMDKNNNFFKSFGGQHHQAQPMININNHHRNLSQSSNMMMAGQSIHQAQTFYKN